VPTCDPASAPRPYGVRGPNTWAVIRDRYLAGASAPHLAELYGLSESGIRKRARREGWRKRDLPDLAPPPDSAATAVASPVPTDLGAAARQAAQAALQALSLGRLKLALDYARVAETLSRVRVRLDGRAGPDPDNPQLEPDQDVLLALAERIAELKLEEAAR
jgi:hypothetical protein